ncbi:MAG: helix-turn-helix domain-containing protein [Candidatus Limnocylindrales bacterium]
MAVEVGGSVREERKRRGWSMRDLAGRAGVAIGLVHDVEAGNAATLESYARLAVALARRPALALVDERARPAPDPRREAEDFVHAAMGELEARALAKPGRTIAIDEPYQHYQFAGRADVLAWEGRDLLHIENRTRFPNLQDAVGSYNAKRQYLARSLAVQLNVGPRGWRSVTNVMACLWSAEVLHVLRLRSASFAALCPDPPDQLEAWLRGEEPTAGVTSSLVVLDPLVPFGSRKRSIAALVDVPRLESRYRGYAEAAEALRRAVR